MFTISRQPAAIETAVYKHMPNLLERNCRPGHRLPKFETGGLDWTLREDAAASGDRHKAPTDIVVGFAGRSSSTEALERAITHVSDDKSTRLVVVHAS